MYSIVYLNQVSFFCGSNLNIVQELTALRGPEPDAGGNAGDLTNQS